MKRISIISALLLAVLMAGCAAALLLWGSEVRRLASLCCLMLCGILALRLLEPVDAVICTLDAINYLTRPAELQETFRRVFRWLRPGGQFIFDVNTPYKLRRMDR